MDDSPRNIKERLMEQLYGKTAMREMERQSELDQERKLAGIRTLSHALVWAGTEEELGGTIARWYKFGWITATSLQDALQKAAVHFVRSDGTSVIKQQAAMTAALSAPTLEPEESRESFVMPILQSKGWSILDWSLHAEVS